MDETSKGKWLTFDEWHRMFRLASELRDTHTLEWLERSVMVELKERGNDNE